MFLSTVGWGGGRHGHIFANVQESFFFKSFRVLMFWFLWQLARGRSNMDKIGLTKQYKHLVWRCRLDVALSGKLTDDDDDDEILTKTLTPCMAKSHQ